MSLPETVSEGITIREKATRDLCESLGLNPQSVLPTYGDLLRLHFEPAERAVSYLNDLKREKEVLEEDISRLKWTRAIDEIDERLSSFEGKIKVLNRYIFKIHKTLERLISVMERELHIPLENAPMIYKHKMIRLLDTALRQMEKID